MGRILTAAMVVLGSTLLAQSSASRPAPKVLSATTGGVCGRIFRNGTPEAGVVIMVTDKGQRTWTGTTDQSGRFWLGMLPAGTYDVFGSKKGFSVIHQRGVVRAGAWLRMAQSIDGLCGVGLDQMLFLEPGQNSYSAAPISGATFRPEELASLPNP
jgi:hypothetical protein